jgi:regulator of sirC expression with transglutaminase-like and TPR domain
LFKTLGFRGNREDYLDPDNSYLNRVLDRRLGIPITLAAVYLFVARRLRLPLVGVNMPGHFLLRWHGTDTTFYIDAFNEGLLLNEDQCRDFCITNGFGVESLREPATPRQILLRMCRNLHGIYRETDPDRAEHFGRYLALLSPD